MVDAAVTTTVVISNGRNDVGLWAWLSRWQSIVNMFTIRPCHTFKKNEHADYNTVVGTTYTKLGKESATELGYSLVKDKTREERVQSWVAFINDNPTSHLYCARGGQRSEIAQNWLSKNGLDIPRVKGGFKLLLLECIFSLSNKLLLSNALFLLNSLLFSKSSLSFLFKL